MFRPATALLIGLLGLAAAGPAGADDGPEAPAQRLEEALAALDNPYFEIRERAVRVLSALGRDHPGTVGPRLLELLDGPAGRRRLLAIRILGEMAYEPAIGRLIDRLAAGDNTDPLERVTLVGALVRFQDAAEQALLDSPHRQNPAARLVLARIAMPDVLAFIDAFFDEEGNAGWFEGQFDGLKPRGKPALYALILIAESHFLASDPEYLGTRGYDYRWLALHGLGEFGDAEALGVLRRVAEEIDSALCFQGSDIASIESSKRRAVQNAAVACWKCGDREVLVRHLRHLREEIENLERGFASVRSWGSPPPDQAATLADLYWNLAVCLSPLRLTEEVVRAYRKNMEWGRIAGKLPSQFAVAQYNIACTYSRSGMPEKGLEAFYQAIDLGYMDTGWVLKDGDMEKVRALPEFELALAYVEILKVRENPTPILVRRHKRAALNRIGDAVSRDISDPAWIADQRFASLWNEPLFAWHAARFHARRGDGAAAAAALRRAMQIERRHTPESLDVEVPIETVPLSPDFDRVREHPDLRAFLAEHGLARPGNGEEGDD